MKLTHKEVWRKATEFIPGGNSQLSKHPKQFGCVNWPIYYTRAEGCSIWDIEGNKFTDLSLMGVGTCTLGYGCKPIDEAVTRAVRLGTMTTLNCHEEVRLAEVLCEIHPWAEMAKFARTGGEANSIAIRIARAASGRDHIAVCGYHGWHDWYLAANLNDKNNLDNHLFEGLEVKGVPQALNNTIHSFKFNCFESLIRIASRYKLGAIKIEVHRSVPPDLNFLIKLRKFASKENIVLIFDECTSGFRETFGGIHLKYGINPDMAVFGKALGNGYPITAIIGIGSVMESALATFISSTFWTERIGPTAALATLNEMQRLRSWEIIERQGFYMRNRLKELSKRKTYTLESSGTLGIQQNIWYNTELKSISKHLTREMITKGYLSTPLQYLCTKHTNTVIDKYIDNLEKFVQ